MSLLASIIAKQGRRGDTELAHVTQEEKALLKSLGGAGTINPNTGLREYHGQNSYDGYIPGKEELRNDPGAAWGFHVHYEDDATRYYDITGDDYTGIVVDWETTQKQAESDGGWDEYAKSDYSAEEFAGMTDAERRQIGRGIVKAEEGVQFNLSLDDYKGYMPKYDKEEESNIRHETATQVGDIGRSAQSSLLSLTQKSEQRQSQRGFAATGNPMVDRQRENIFKGIEKDVDVRYERGLSDIETHQEDYMEEWETGLTTYMADL